MSADDRFEAVIGDKAEVTGAGRIEGSRPAGDDAGNRLVRFFSN